jgi:hypothetical protein
MDDTDFKRKRKGHVTIVDTTTGEILVDKANAINFENFSLSLAQTLSNRPFGWIQEMDFGNGAATVSGTGTITYLPPNVVGQNANLYNETFSQVVNDQSQLDTNPSQNFMTVNHTVGTTFSDIVVNCFLGLNIPAGQDAFDTGTNINETFTFNEIGLRAFSVTGAADAGLLLTHVVFNPIQKSLNRTLQITYTIRIQTSS